jgi:hypothetical protein
MYTYLIGWRDLNSWYYGSRVANIKPPKEDLFCEYFTSSNIVKRFILEHGMPDVVKIHKEFTSSKLCRLYEVKFLKFVDIKNNIKWLNINDIHAPPILSGEDNGFFGKSHTKNTRDQWSKIRKGKKHSDERKAKMCGRIPWNKGKIGCFSKETLLKMSKSQCGRIPWNKGKIGVFSDETIQKMSAAKIGFPGKKHTTESKSNISNKRIGRKWFYNPITMDCVCSYDCPYGYIRGMIKKNNGRLGYKHSNETKIKMSKSAKNRK